MKLLRFSITISLKEDNISQLGDYDAPFCEQQYTHGSCHISLFKFKSLDQLIPPPPKKKTVSNFRHLLSCGNIEIYRGCNNMLTVLIYMIFGIIHFMRTSAPFDLKRQYFPHKLNKLPSFLQDFNFWNRFASLHL